MRVFADFSGTIAVPAVLASLLGTWLDKKYDTEPWFLIVFLLLAFLSTGIWIQKKAKAYEKEYERLLKK
jgi:F0F1-type ATP synthase assembly protein I